MTVCAPQWLGLSRVPQGPISQPTHLVPAWLGLSRAPHITQITRTCVSRVDLCAQIRINVISRWHSAPDEEQGDQNVPQKVCSVVSGILDNIEEKIKTHCKYKHLIHVEHQLDATTGRDLVRIWKCVDVDHYPDFGYDQCSCPEGVYYDWQKIDVVNIWIKKTWKTTTSWQMITRNETEQQLLLSQDPDPPSSRVTDIGTMMEEAIVSSASETQEVKS